MRNRVIYQIETLYTSKVPAGAFCDCAKNRFKDKFQSVCVNPDEIPRQGEKLFEEYKDFKLKNLD
jgi:hypothetical protein